MKHTDRAILISAVSVALAISMVLALAPRVCEPCQAAAVTLLSGRLSIVGVVFYLLLLMIAFVPRFCRFTLPLLAFAGGAHAVFLHSLFRSRYACPLCVAIAGCVWIALLVLLLRESRGRRLNLTFLLVGVVAAFGLIGAGELVTKKVQQVRVTNATDEALRQFPAEPGVLSVVIVRRLGCPICKQLEEEVSWIEKDYRNQVSIHYVEAAPKVPVPIVVLVGEPPVVFSGKPTLLELRRAIEGGLERQLGSPSLSEVK